MLDRVGIPNDGGGLPSAGWQGCHTSKPYFIQKFGLSNSGIVIIYTTISRIVLYSGIVE